MLFQSKLCTLSPPPSSAPCEPGEATTCVPSSRAPTTAPDAPPLHLYSTSDPADSVPTSPMTPPNPHFRIQSSFYLPPPNPPAVAIPVAAQPAVAVPTRTCRLQTRLVVPAAAQPTLAVPSAQPAVAVFPIPPPSQPSLFRTPSNSDTDHSDDAEF